MGTQSPIPFTHHTKNMRFIEILQRCKGHRVVINNNEERTVLEVDEDFIVLRGGNPQMQLTEFVPVSTVAVPVVTGT